VAIDASGMLQDFTGEPAEKVGDTFVIHMDRESLNDIPLGKYDVTVHITVLSGTRRSPGIWGPISRFPTSTVTASRAVRPGSPMSRPTTTGQR
jgi:hypothetical protein